MNSIDKNEVKDSILVYLWDSSTAVDEFSSSLENFNKDNLRQLVWKYYALKLSELLINKDYKWIEKLESITEFMEVLV
jgi:hypothetical protein